MVVNESSVFRNVPDHPSQIVVIILLVPKGLVVYSENISLYANEYENASVLCFKTLHLISLIR